jgi:hypothetical protein
MAGSIEIDGKLWTAASWLFRWVLNRIVENVNVGPVGEATLEGILDENLGWLSVDDLEPEYRSTVRKWIAENLVADAHAVIPLDLAIDRGAVLAHLDSLARMAVDNRGDDPDSAAPAGGSG